MFMFRMRLAVLSIPATGCVHAGIGIPNPPPETCNGLDDDCDGQVDERELYPMCVVRR